MIKHDPSSTEYSIFTLYSPQQGILLHTTLSYTWHAPSQCILPDIVWCFPISLAMNNRYSSPSSSVPYKHNYMNVWHMHSLSVAWHQISFMWATILPSFILALSLSFPCIIQLIFLLQWYVLLISSECNAKYSGIWRSFQPFPQNYRQVQD